ncbi:hypothetical protein ACO0SA_001021 [Hanseniaspora valbyensis]
MTDPQTKPKNIHFSKFISNIDSKRFKPGYCSHGSFPSKLKEILAAQKPEDIIQMASGDPNKETFCVKNITVNHTLKVGNKHFDSLSTANDYDSVVNSFYLGDKTFSQKQKNTDTGYVAKDPIESVFKYSTNTYGLNSTLDLYSGILDKFDYFGDNKSQRENYDVMITSGTAASTFYLAHLLCDENKTMLIEEFTYPAIMSNISMTRGHYAPFNLNTNATAENGENPIDISYLKNLLKNWFEIYPNKPFPTVLYTITIQNPLCLVQTLKHKKEVYDICAHFGIMIIEDDPYGTIMLDKKPTTKVGKKLDNFNNEKKEYLNALAKNSSYLAVDTENIVIRCESASKVFAPGLRVGFIVGHKFFIDKLKHIVESSTREISGPSMTIFNQCVYGMDNLLAKELETLKIDPLDGWLKWCMNLSELYTERQNILIQNLYNTDAYKKGLFTVILPKFGIFLCIKLNLEDKKPDLLKSCLDMKKGMQYMDYKLLEQNVISIVGPKFTSDVEHSYKKCGFIRFTVAGSTGEKFLIKAATCIGKAVENFFDEYLTENQPYEVVL